jgi:hypothetical protein
VGIQTIERVFPDEVPLFGGTRARRLERRRRIFTATSIALALLLAVGTGFVFTQRNRTTAVTLGQAVNEFRAAGHTSEIVQAKIATKASKLLARTGGRRPEAAAVGSAIPAHAATVAPYVLPAEGVYSYRTTGGESISMFGASHTYPDETHATVRHLGGCKWDNTNDVIKEHTDHRTLCSRGGQFLQLAQGREVEFFGQRDGQTYTCDPGELQSAVADTTGTTSTDVCTAADGSKATIKRSVLNDETMNIGGATVKAVRFRLDSTMTGRANGAATETFWISPVTGLTLRWERSVDTMANSAFGEIRYQEQATFVLESLEPRS